MLKKCERIIQTLNIEFINAQNAQITEPHTIENEKIVENRLIHVHKNNIHVKVDGQSFHVEPGDLIFLSSGSTATITYGGKNSIKPSSDLTSSYLNPTIEYENDMDSQEIFEKHFSYVEFSVKAYGAIDFFRFMGLPPFIIKKSTKILKLFEVIFLEIKQGKIGKSLILKSSAVHILVSLIRYILSPHVSTDNISEKLLIKIDALMDLRLVKIFKYISENISNSLSNSVIAKQVGLNEYYIGQFFTKHTRMSLQTYVQMVRLNKSLDMLRTTELKIQDIRKAVGFKDDAYFCKQFRIVFGDSPKKVQKKYIDKL